MERKISVFRCTTCDSLTDYEKLDHDGYDNVACPHCNGDVKFAHERPVQWASVAVYFTDRAYGGPEEGGWYYTTGSVDAETIRCFPAGDFPAMMAYRDLLEMRYPEKNAVVKFWDERIAPAGFPARRPRYC